jgi:hypothetical protein
MNPAQIIKLMNSIDKGDMDISSLKSIGNIFDM